MQIKENIKAPRHWLLCREFTGDRWIPRTKVNNAEKVSIWWRHHAKVTFRNPVHESMESHYWAHFRTCLFIPLIISTTRSPHPVSDLKKSEHVTTETNKRHFANIIFKCICSVKSDLIPMPPVLFVYRDVIGMYSEWLNTFLPIFLTRNYLLSCLLI